MKTYGISITSRWSVGLHYIYANIYSCSWYWFFLGILSIHQQSHHHVSMFAGRTGGTWTIREGPGGSSPAQRDPRSTRWTDHDARKTLAEDSLTSQHLWEYTLLSFTSTWKLMLAYHGWMFWSIEQFQTKDIERPLVAWFNCRRRAWGFIDTSESIAPVSLTHWGHSKLPWDPTSTTIL